MAMTARSLDRASEIYAKIATSPSLRARRSNPGQGSLYVMNLGKCANAKDHRREDGCYPPRRSSASAPRMSASLQSRSNRCLEPWPRHGGLPSLWI